MARTLVLMFAAVSLALSSGCIPYHIHMDVANRCEEYRKIIDGHQREHEKLVNDARKANAERDRYKAENERLNEIVKANEKAIEDFKRLEERFRSGLVERVRETGLTIEEGVKVTDEGTISIEGEVLFDAGSADLRQKAKEILARLAPALKKYEDCYLRIDGHTDKQPIRVSPFKSNFHLGAIRAHAVLMELKNLGIPEEKMYIASYGENRPAKAYQPNQKDVRENRRVEIAVVKTAR